MEKIQQEVYKSGKHIFLTEEECLAYEQRVQETEFKTEIINFLISEGLKQLNYEKAIKLLLDDKVFTKWEFFFVSNKIFITKRTNEFNNKPSEEFSVNLTNIETFKSLFFDLLGVKKRE